MSRITSLFLLALPAVASAQETPGTVVSPGMWEPVIEVNGQAFATWQEYAHSQVFQESGLRCGTVTVETSAEEFRVQSDCATNTTIKPEYEPAAGPLYRIPVVFHVLRSSTGSGNVSDALINSQIDILNEDFQAIAGTLGENGTDAKIEFFLATEDPAGNPTTGITRDNNTTWYNDSGSYWTTLAWDTTRYLNIYTNQAGGALGYVPALPHNGIVGSTSDRVVCLWSAVGRNAPIGPPYNQGRTATHEVGHYLGLNHTFSGGCGTASCYTTGDRICDTNHESSPFFGCGSRSTCGSPDPIENYMDYSDDTCMELFTPEQANRMRCTLQNWRVDLAQPELPTCGNAASATVRNGGTNPSVYTSNAPTLGEALTLSVGSAPYNFCIVYGYSAVDNQVLAGGQTVLIDFGSLLMFKQSCPVGGSVNLGVPLNINLCGLQLFTQALLIGGTTPFALTNAVDMVIGS